MQLPNARTILIALGSLVVLVLVVVAIVTRTRKPVPPAEPTALVAEPTTSASPVVGQTSTVPPMLVGRRLYLAEGLQLTVYRFDDRSLDVVEVPSDDPNSKIIAIAPSPRNDRLMILQLELGVSREYVLFDVVEKKILTRFGERVLGLNWAPQSDQLLIFGKSTQRTFFFSTSRLDGKDQKVLAQVEDERAQPLALSERQLIFATTDSSGQTRLNALDRTSGTSSVIVEDVGRYAVSEDSSYVAFNASEGLYVLVTTDLTQQRVAAVEIDHLLNWSNKLLIYGHSETGSFTIDAWDAEKNQTSTITSLAAGTMSFPKAAFFDEINKELIYWTDKAIVTEPF